MGGEISRNVFPQINGEIQRVPEWGGPKFWFTNIEDKSAMKLFGALSLKGEKRLDKSLPSKGGGFPKAIKVKNLTKLRGKGREDSGKWKYV